MKNTYIFIAGCLGLGVALLHTIGGQITLVNPMMNTALDMTTKTELLGAWHIVTVLLYATAYVLMVNGRNLKEKQMDLVKFIGWIYLLCGAAFVFVNLLNITFTPQWILFFPMGILVLFGLKKVELT